MKRCLGLLRKHKKVKMGIQHLPRGTYHSTSKKKKGFFATLFAKAKELIHSH